MSESARPTLSELLRTFRTRAGLTQARAEKARLSEQAISVLERGTRTRPRIDTIPASDRGPGPHSERADQFLSVARGKGEPRDTAGSKQTPARHRCISGAVARPPAAQDFTGRAANSTSSCPYCATPPGPNRPCWL